MKHVKFLFISLILIMSNTLSATEKRTESSRELWLKFTGTNYCKRGFCAEAVPSEALKKALNFYKNRQDLINNNDYVGIIDFSLHSTVKRFFILNLKSGAVESMLVTHGKNSETDLGVAGTFSNTINSEMSSLGFFITDAESYIGKHGISLRLDGVSETNSNARARNIVLHGADYATQWFADSKGRLGLSQGCPAVAPNKIAGVIKKLKGQGLLYLHSSR